MGLRSFSVSGRVKNPGLYLLPSGSTILDIIEVSNIKEALNSALDINN